MTPWRFVTQGMQAQSQTLWWGSAESMAQALQGAQSISWQWNLPANAALEQLRGHLQSQGQTAVKIHQPRALFEPVDSRCPGFTGWWRQTRVMQ